MNFRGITSFLLIVLTVTMVVFTLCACQMQSRSEKTGTISSEQQTSKKVVKSDNGEPPGIFQTGQKRTLMATDDGDLRVGKPWPEPRFIDHGDGTVTDRVSGLMWTRHADKANGKVDWEQAISGAGTCTDGGHDDWRLPNRNELASLIDLGKYNPALPEGHPFTGVQPSYYWTSTTPANNEDHGWLIHLYIGFVAHDDKAGTHYVWYVRNDQ